MRSWGPRSAAARVRDVVTAETGRERGRVEFRGVLREKEEFCLLHRLALKPYAPPEISIRECSMPVRRAGP